ncbi:MAG: toxin-antitoxin system HicB family antitoxin [Hamadaea sp.]|uniref:toxin-antitoxin system HicB family antitoxin n=1 Tax=Hamadaea sp. TaxID=2024425 RepID=UPI0017B64F08|nr:toxin-antitoxin system HicB family antitoxin [Hamadaea sp.]NUR74063.1 toxin-antitoxin system HicB family antitoxin [Hamadaea sp.]NUT19756.1 toxin-antitoxin system HicB family antitoxin [Hamadaea sp.]
MELSPYLENLQRDLTAAAAPGGDDVTRAAGLLAGSLEASARLCLMEALSDAAAEITSKLSSASVEVRLRGRDADLVVTETVFEPEQPIPAATTPPPTEGEQARITLRLPEQLKEAVERAAAAEGVSVNAWLVRALWGATQPAPPGPGFRPGPAFPPGPGQGFQPGRRITGYAQS